MTTNPIVKQFYENRGYDETYLESIEKTSQNPMKNRDTLCEALKEVRDKKERITILPDFDMDGISAGILGYGALTELSFKASLYVPTPSDGYGFNPYVAEKLLERFPDTKAIITCDNGITCYEGIKHFKEKGIKVFVTDHHQYQKETGATVTVDPTIPGDLFEHKGVSGAFVLYHVLEAFTKRYEDAETLLRINRLKVFAGIGTVSDAMPLLYDNRELVRDMSSILKWTFSEKGVIRDAKKPFYRLIFQGLYAMLRVIALRGETEGLSPSKEENLCDNFLKGLDEDTIGFYVAPIFNAVKRLDKDMHLAFDVFLSRDLDSAIEAAKTLFLVNQERKEVVEYYLSKLTFSKDKDIFVYISDAPKGILGLLAQKIINETGRPTFVLRYEEHTGRYEGSARTPSWYPGLTRLKTCLYKDYAAGHEVAFGIGIYKEELPFFESFVREDSKEAYEEAEVIDLAPDFIVTTIYEDLEEAIPLNLTMGSEYTQHIQNLKPFGEGFRRPEGVLRLAPLEVGVTRLGANNEHLKLHTSEGLEVLLFFQSHLLPEILKKNVIEVVGDFSINEFRGKKTLNFKGDVNLS